MNILITGGCGYVGTMLVEDLLEIGYEVVVVDNQWFGNYLTDHDKLTVYKQDIRDLDDQKSNEDNSENTPDKNLDTKEVEEEKASSIQ